MLFSLGTCAQRLGLGLIVLGVSAGCGATSAEPRDAGSQASVLNDQLPKLNDYKSIPLPTTAPVDGAFVRAFSFADPAASGQHISFQYADYTVNACWRKLDVSEPDACLPQVGVTVIRDIKNAESETLFTVSTKDLSSLPAGASATVEFFKTAELKANPGWVGAYAAKRLEGAK
jgi:hypothetical protein